MTEYNFYCDESCHLEYDNALVKQLKRYEKYKTV